MTTSIAEEKARTLTGLEELLARGLWHHVLEEIKTDEETAILESGDDWHQYLPEAKEALHTLVNSKKTYHASAQEREES